jgi:transposase
MLPTPKRLRGDEPAFNALRACVKTDEQQAGLMLVGVRDRLIRNRTQLTNAIRGYAAEFGLIAAKGMAHITPLLERIQTDEGLPVLAREMFAIQAKEYTQLQAQIDELDAKLKAWLKADECSKRLAKIPGVGPIGAALLTMKTPAPELFQSGRQFAAWIGLTPKDHSTGGKVRLGVITRAGDDKLRSVLVVGATAVIQQAQRSGRMLPWLAGLLVQKFLLNGTALAGRDDAQVRRYRALADAALAGRNADYLHIMPSRDLADTRA